MTLDPIEKFLEVGPFSLPSVLDMKVMQEKYEGAMLGLAIGDATGSPYEGLSPESMKDDFDPIPNDHYATSHHRAHLQIPGDFMDDTAYSLIWAAILIKQRIPNGLSYFERLKSWFQMGYMSSTFDGIGSGNTTRGVFKIRKAEYGTTD